MHTTTTHINTTFERAEVGLGSFPTLVCCLPSGVGGRERERPFWSGSGLGLRFGSWGLSGAEAGSSALLGSFGLPWISSQPLASVPGPSVGEASGSGEGVLAGRCAVLIEMWLRFDGGAGQLAWCGGVCRAGGWVAGILGLLQGLGVGMAGCPVLGVLWWPSSNASFCGSCPWPGAGLRLAVRWVGRRSMSCARTGVADEMCLAWSGWPARPSYPAGACFPVTD
ncbi:hypothetical protein ATANTOWER_026483 [Ataeniobius toweri]|uniref:Uncharacterized protein n=1 Tax=Ataeniobius toweri TaxID=208326 RepID=A0ABU7BXW6_9TELE|nr:hypothetical protein [Ataeniobius toweri]